MLDCHMDGFNVDGQSDATAEDDVPKDKSVSPNLQIQKSDVESCTASQDSFEVNCNLKTLISHMDIMGKLLEQVEVKDLFGFQCETSSHSEPIPEISDDDKHPVPYFIPELQMSCVSAETGHIKELALASFQNQNAMETKVLELPVIMEANISQVEELSIPVIVEPNVFEVEEDRLPKIKEPTSAGMEDISVSTLEESQATVLAGSSGVENVSEPLVIIPVIQEPTPISLAQNPMQIEEPITKVKKTMQGLCAGIFRSIIGLKPIWRPSVRLCFGDRKRRWTKSEEEDIKQETSKVLKSLLVGINLSKMLRACCQEKNNNKLDQMERSSLNYSRVFRQNIFHPNPTREEHRENLLAAGEPVERRPIIRNEVMRRVYRLDASDGWAGRGPDSDSSDCDSDDSGIKSNLDVSGYSRLILKINQPIADRQDIEYSARILFSQPVKLFRFNSVRKWQRVDNGYPYTGVIKILERHGLYYILLRERNSNFLLVYTRVDGNWQIRYMENRSDSCGWFNFNYAFCPEGTPEHFACTFQEPGHAAEFVARVRNLVIKSRFLCLP